MSCLAPPTFKDPNDGSFVSGGRLGGMSGAGFEAFAAGRQSGGGDGMTGAGFGACSFAAGTAGTGDNGTDKGDALCAAAAARDRKSTRLNSSHGYISYAVFCLKKTKYTTALLE